MLRQEILNLLAGIHPLDELSDDDLGELSEVALDYYPAGTTILAHGGKASEFLYVIQRGTVRMALDGEEDGELVIDYRSEGEFFGLISVVSGDTPRATSTAEEDTICLLIPRDRLLAVLERNPGIAEKLLRSYFIDFIDKTHDETRRRYQSVSNNHRLLFGSTVGELIRRSPVTASPDVSIQEGSRIMVEQGISSLVVTDPEGAPLGIITDRDLREKVVATSRDPSEPLAAIMTTSLVHVDADAPCSDALLKMMHHNIHHILVLEQGRFKGMVTNHDFMVLQGTSPTLLVRKVSESRNLERLVETTKRLEQTVGILSREGAKAHHVGSVVTEVTDRLVRQALSLIDPDFEAPRQPFALAVTGEAGRRELSLHREVTIVAVLEENGEHEKAQAQVGQYLRGLCAPLGRVLASCGVATPTPCIPDGLIQTPSGWMARLDSWVSADLEDREPELLDMRAVYGNAALIDDLRERMLLKVSSDSRLLNRLANLIFENRPPLGFFHRFVVDTNGEHSQELNLFASGIRPFVDALRVLACEHGVAARQSRKRLAAVAEQCSFVPAEDVEKALEYLQTLRIHHQLAHASAGREIDDSLDPQELTRRERSSLKRVFQLGHDLHDQIRRRYSS